jgi:hypothetical protein
MVVEMVAGLPFAMHAFTSSSRVPSQFQFSRYRPFSHFSRDLCCALCKGNIIFLWYSSCSACAFVLPDATG